MKPLEKKKIELDLAKCKAAKQQIEYQILEKEESIDRDKKHLILQEEREQELLKLLKGE